MSTETNPVQRAVAFYHRDGLVAAWNHAAKYAGRNGRIATLPDIVTARLATEPRTDESPWENWYTSASAEYVGIGADGRVKIIVAHGVGPMSTIDGIKAAYKWEYGDRSRLHNGGRITAQQFLDLEAGRYGEVNVVNLTADEVIPVHGFRVAAVNVLDFEHYLEYAGRDVFMRYATAQLATTDPLLRLRLGPDAERYILAHDGIAAEFHRTQRPNDRYTWSQGFDDKAYYRCIMKVEDASNRPYIEPEDTRGKPFDEWVWHPRVPEPGYALAHLLDIERLTQTHTQEVGVILLSSPGVHEWSNGAKFVAVPPQVSLEDGIAAGPDASSLLRTHWQHYMEPATGNVTPIKPFRLERAGEDWFTHYSKRSAHEQTMDDGDIEFHVRSVEPVGREGAFTTDELFFLRYKLTQVRNIMPPGANAYEIIDVSPRNDRGITTVTVRFYRADVDLTRRLPRASVLARDFDRLMEVYAR